VVVAPVGSASRAGLLTCPASLHPFAQFGDAKTYFGFTNNGFENGSGAWRMFAKSNGANGSLRAQIVFYGLLGNVTGILNVTSFDPSDYGSWEPSADVPSLLSLPIATVSAQLRLTNTGSSGTWQVDDVFVDPCGMRG